MVERINKKEALIRDEDELKRGEHELKAAKILQEFDCEDSKEAIALAQEFLKRAEQKILQDNLF